MRLTSTSLFQSSTESWKRTCGWLCLRTREAIFMHFVRLHCPYPCSAQSWVVFACDHAHALSHRQPHLRLRMPDPLPSWVVSCVRMCPCPTRTFTSSTAPSTVPDPLHQFSHKTWRMVAIFWCGIYCTLLFYFQMRRNHSGLLMRCKNSFSPTSSSKQVLHASRRPSSFTAWQSAPVLRMLNGFEACNFAELKARQGRIESSYKAGIYTQTPLYSIASAWPSFHLCCCQATSPLSWRGTPGDDRRRKLQTSVGGGRRWSSRAKQGKARSCSCSSLVWDREQK